MPVPPIRRIIAATDFSPGANAAVERAAQLAHAHGALLELLHAFDSSAWQSLVSVLDMQWLGGGAAPENALRRQLDALAAALAQREGLKVETHFAAGAPATVIAARARSMNAAAVVLARSSDPAALGTSGTLLRLLRHAPCPVLVVRDDGAKPYGRVLTAIDLREVSRRAAERALALFPAARHRLLYVVDPQWQHAAQQAGAEQAGGLLATLHGQARQKLEALAAELQAQTAGAGGLETEVADARPALGIVEQAAAWPADCVVVGRHGQGLVAETLLGSTALDVIHHSGRDVLVVS